MFVAVLLVLFGVVSLVEFVFAFFGRVSAEERNTRYIERKRTRIVRSAFGFWMCVIGIVCLLSGLTTPILTLVTVSGMLALGYAMARINFDELLGK